MSLINQMLRDLDARQAPSSDRVALPAAVHALPPEPPRSWPKFAAAGVLAGVAALSWYVLAGRGDPPKPPSSPPAAAVQSPPSPLSPPSQALATPAQPSAPVALAATPAVAAQQAIEPPTSAVAVAALPLATSPASATVAAPTPIGAVRAAPSLAAPSLAAPPPAEPVPAKPAPAKALVLDKPPVLAKPPLPAKAPVLAKAPVPAPPSTAAAAAQPSSIDKRPRNAPANEMAEAEYRKAMLALRRGAASEAIAGLRTALRADPRHVSARQALLSVLIEQQQWSEAEQLMEEGLAIDATQVTWAMALARLQLEHGKLAEAVQTLVRHAGHAEKSADYQAFLALLLHKEKRPDEAAQRYHMALALKPNESRWWYGLGLVLDADQKPQEARAAFMKARDTGNLTPELAGVVDQRLR